MEKKKKNNDFFPANFVPQNKEEEKRFKAYKKRLVKEHL